MTVSRKFMCVVFIFIILKVTCYEKTLRKIVRSQSKMVQRPFSDVRIRASPIRNTVHAEPHVELMFPSYNQEKKVHNIKKSKISSYLSSIDLGGGCMKPRNIQSGAGPSIINRNLLPTELRMARNTEKNISYPPVVPSTTENLLFLGNSINKTPYSRNSSSEEIAIDTYYEIPQPSRTVTKPKMIPTKFQRLMDENMLDKQKVIIIPNDNSVNNSKTSVLKGVFLSNSNAKKKESSPHVNSVYREDSSETSERVDFLIQERPMDVDPSTYTYNITSQIFMCNAVLKEKADIDAQDTFSRLEIEPHWAPKKHFWDSIFETRYENLMRSPQWPALKVFLIPRTQVHCTWRKTFEQYHNDTVHKIISNVIKKLQFYGNLTFNWNEVAHLSQWWKTTSSKSRSAFRRLLKSGRLEITTGGFVETDEATSHIFGLIHQMMEGQQWLKNYLNYIPEAAWMTNSVTHSSTMSYLLSESGISNLVITNLHFSWEEYLAEYQYSDFVWIQKWKSERFNMKLNQILRKVGEERYPQNAVLTHYIQFNSDGFAACGPNRTICTNVYDFTKTKANANNFNIKDKAEVLLEQYSKSGTLSKHNTIMAPLGGPFRYETHADFDYQYNNYEKVSEYINLHRDIYKATVQFGTPKQYFEHILDKHKSYPSLTGDFLNFADLNNGSPAYWTGFYTSRPWFKILLRRLQSTLRSTEILLSFAINFSALQGFDATEVYKMLSNIRDQVARVQDRHVVSGTLTASSLKYLYREILTTVKNCWFIQEIAASLLSLKPNKNLQKPYLEKYVYREGEFISMFRVITPGDQLYIFNSLAHERTEVVELIVRDPNIRILDHNKKEVTIQINPIWKHQSDNLIRLSKLFFKIEFVIVIPPLTFELYKIKETYDSSQHAATIYCLSCVVEDIPSAGTTFPFTVLPIEPGDIQLESYRYRLIFDESTGFLRTVKDKLTGAEKLVSIDYGAFRSSSTNAGVFLFNTDVIKPLKDVLMSYRLGIKTKVLMIVSGEVSTELTSIYGRTLHSTVKIFNLLQSPISHVIFVESKVDFETSPKNRDIELFMSIQTNINNGAPPEIVTDSNGFMYVARTLNISRRIESNIYPMTTMAFIQDQRNRVTVITDHAQGVTALQEGQIVVLLDRRILYNDGRGSNEGLADSCATFHRHLILLENFADPAHSPAKENVWLPSLIAVHLSNSLDNKLDIFRIDKMLSDYCYYGFLPLVKTSFPCDVSLINFRINLNRGSLALQPPNTALMVLHRQSFSCFIGNERQLMNEIHCSGDSKFSLEKILHKITSVHRTNLCGTNKGVPVGTLNTVLFPPMEIATLKIRF